MLLRNTRKRIQEIGESVFGKLDIMYLGNLRKCIQETWKKCIQEIREIVFRKYETHYFGNTRICLKKMKSEDEQVDLDQFCALETIEGILRTI